MRSSENLVENPVLETANRLSCLSIVIDDFDSAKSNGEKELKMSQDVAPLPQPPKHFARQSSNASIKKILEEAEHRKFEFGKLIDEYSAVLENLKRIEQLESNGSSSNLCKVPQSPITT